MIIAIRERLFKNKNVIAYIFFGVLGLAFLMPNFVRKISLHGDWIVRVNGQEVSYFDYARKVQSLEYHIMMIRQHYGQYADMFLKAMGLGDDLKELALKSIIDEELLNQASHKIGINFDQEYVNQMLSSAHLVQQVMPDLIPAYVFDESGEISEERLALYLKRVRLSPTNFEFKVRQALGRVMLLRLLFAGVTTPSFALQELFVQKNQARKYAVITIPFEKILQQEKAKAVTEADIQSFFERTKQEYRVPEKRAGHLWTFSPESYDLAVSNQDIEVYYDTHRTQRFIQTPAQVTVRHILFAVDEKSDEAAVAEKAAQVRQELVRNPALFATKAREVSQDAATARDGGLMKPFAKGTGNQVFEKTSFLLQENGDISEVIRTDKGFEIIQRVDKSQVVFKPLDAVKKEIRAEILKQKFGQTFADDIKRIQVQGAEAVQEFVKEKQTASTKALALKARSADPVTQALFTIEQKGGFASLVEGNKGMLIQLSEIEPAYVPGLESIKDDVVSDLYEVRAQETIKTLLQEGRMQAMQKPMAEVAGMVHGEYQVTDFVRPNNADDRKSLQLKKLPTSSMLKLEKAGLTLVHATERDGYIVRCQAVAPWDKAAFEADTATLSKEAGQEYMNTLASGFVASLYRDATIEIGKQQADE